MTNSERFSCSTFFHTQDNLFRVLPEKMQPRPDQWQEESYQEAVALTDRKALIYRGGDSGTGRAVAIALHVKADVAINYLPDEEEDAREVVDSIQKAGRSASGTPLLVISVKRHFASNSISSGG